MSPTEKSSFSVADPGEGPGGPTTPLLLDQTEARRAEKKSLPSGKVLGKPVELSTG